MDIKLVSAIQHWFSKSSYDMVYLEAVANALDANATQINIRFSAPSESDYSHFHLEIEDNGVGFTNERYERFRSLMDVDDQDIAHRGLGRLVYLFYFTKVHIESRFPDRKREFDFSEGVTEYQDDTTLSYENTGTTLYFDEYKDNSKYIWTCTDYTVLLLGDRLLSCDNHIMQLMELVNTIPRYNNKLIRKIDVFGLFNCHLGEYGIV